MKCHAIDSASAISATSVHVSTVRWRAARARLPEKWPTNEDVAVHVGFISDWKRRGSFQRVVHNAAVRGNGEIVGSTARNDVPGNDGLHAENGEARR